MCGCCIRPLLRVFKGKRPASFREVDDMSLNKTNKTFEHQLDAAKGIDNPITAHLYDWEDENGNPLGFQNNVRIISIFAKVNWAVTQPTPLEAIVTVDGRTLVFKRNNPDSGSSFFACFTGDYADTDQELSGDNWAKYRAFLLEGRRVKIQFRITWATTQPTYLGYRVKWAKK